MNIDRMQKADLPDIVSLAAQLGYSKQLKQQITILLDKRSLIKPS